MEQGSPLAGEIDASVVFQKAYKPCLSTLQQMEDNARRRNELVMSMTKSSGSETKDLAAFTETREEIRKGWPMALGRVGAWCNDIQEISPGPGGQSEDDR